MVLLWIAFLRICMLVTAVTVGLIGGVMISSAIAHASLPEPLDGTRIAPTQVAWFESDAGNVRGSGEVKTDEKNSGMNALAAKFSKYDLLFKNVFDNAHSALDGYQVKYKITF
jgi:hypothetical protein